MKMTDYIKREYVMREILEEYGIDTDNEDVDMIFDMVINAPSYDVVPVRHGRWVESFKVNAPPTLRSRWTCSWCGNVQTYGITDYCPNCGAKMDAKE